ncbi:hypothetical protein [Streptomyces glaucus]|uniref:Uncharacterized protein n=1 Tax=Streptomyces glaucus TaxID=284029 RepID=A0ABN3J9U2_9ACTN
MAAPLSCADLMAEAQAEYAALPLKTRAGNTAHLRNLLMLPSEALKSARVLLEAFEKNQAALLELEPKLRELLLLVADDSKAMGAEMKTWPLGMFLRVVNLWQEATRVPKAPDWDS